MEQTREKKRGFAAIFRLCPRRHVLLLVSAALIATHLLTRGDRALNAALSENFVRPIHRFLSGLTACVPFSVAELLIALAVIGLAVYLLVTLVQLIRRGERLKRLYRLLVTLAAFGLMVYALFCLLWGVYYYGEDFCAASGLETRAISTEELRTVTAYFAALANETAEQVPRSRWGYCATDRQEVLRRAPELYGRAETRFPCLSSPPRPAKGIFFSRIMSYIDFSGFFFPFTAEANVNMDAPPGFFASTVAHELAHQRGVAKEQEANFVGVMACLEYGEADFVYSAALLAYTHLGNALYSADHDAWEEVYATLSDDVQRDLDANRRYWQQFKTPVQTVSNKVYEGFLYSYDQNLGLRSYGACVDLLVCYYLDTATAALP